MSGKIKELTLVVNDSELSDLYHIIKKYKRISGSSTSYLCQSWLNEWSDVYRSGDKYNILFKGINDVDILFGACVYYMREYNVPDKIEICKNIRKMLDPDFAYALERVAEEERVARERMELEQQQEQERREEEQRQAREREEQIAREAEELRQRAAAGDAWDTGVVGGNNGVWDANQDNQDSPF